MKKRPFVVCVINDKNIERFNHLLDILHRVVGKTILTPTFINSDYQDLLDSSLLVSTVPTPWAFEANQGQFLRTKRFVLITNGTEREMQDAEDFAKKYPNYICVSAFDLTNKTKIPEVEKALRLLIYS
jgi:hypothetical protein